MKTALTILVLMMCNITFCQSVGEDDASAIVMEDDKDKEDDADSENDYQLQQLEHFMRHPININSDEVEQLTLLNQVQINSLRRYRQLLGDLIDIHELQAVPGFSIDVIKKILAYVTVNANALTRSNLHQRLTGGERSVLLRLSLVPEKSKGFLDADSSPSHFTGSRAAVMTRYKYQYRNVLQYGFITDKDAGETILTKNHLPQFVSAHFFMRQAGKIKSLALGDFTVNMGQGLIQWQSQAFGKNSAVINIKRQSEVLRPYHSAGEYNFNRGAGVTIALTRTELTVFASKRNLSANVSGNAITSIVTSGLNRTWSEMNDRNTATLVLAGATVKRFIRSANIACNYVFARYSLPLSRRKEPYTIYSIAGTTWSNYSIDYSFTFRNFHFFGEAALDHRFNQAHVHGVLASLGQKMDLSLLYRHLSQPYQAVYGNAFTESSAPTNEEGFYAGIHLKPHQQWQIDVYADVFRFPWLKYRLNAPATGSAYLIQVTFRPAKRIEMYTRIRTRLKPLNTDNDVPGTNAIINWRTHLNIQASRTIIIRSRLEWSTFNNNSLTYPETGYLYYAEVFYKPLRSRFSGNTRFQAFEASSYDTRIYTYESDLLFVSSTPAYYNNGVHYYVNLRARFKLKYLAGSDLVVNLKAASTVYTNISVIGTGASAISGKRSSSLKMQFFLSF